MFVRVYTKFEDHGSGRQSRGAVNKSQAVTLGKISEHLVPYFEDFPFNPKDARFLGGPVDFIVFNGLNEDEVKSVVFVEVKTGKSGLTTRERRVRDAIQARSVEWLELRLAASPTDITEQERTEPESPDSNRRQILPGVRYTYAS